MEELYILQDLIVPLYIYNISKNYCVQSSGTVGGTPPTSGGGGGNGGNGGSTGQNPGGFDNTGDPYSDTLTPNEIFLESLDIRLGFTDSQYNWCKNNASWMFLIDSFLDGESENFIDARDFAKSMIDLFIEIGYNENDVKGIITNGITSSAEFVHLLYTKIESRVHNDSMLIRFANYFIDKIRDVAATVVDIHHSTASWNDIILMWLFELGPDEINFTDGDNVISALKLQQGPLDAKNKIYNRIDNNGNLIGSSQYVYGVDQFYNDTNLVTLTLGSYSTNFEAVNMGSYYNIIYTSNNISSWESATRFRIDNDNNGVHDGIIPSKNRGEGLHLGGNFKQTYLWKESY